MVRPFVGTCDVDFLFTSVGSRKPFSYTPQKVRVRSSGVVPGPPNTSGGSKETTAGSEYVVLV